MRTLLICQADHLLCRDGMPPWLASFSDLCGVVVLHDHPGMRLKRVRREGKRVGWLRLLDIAAFRLHHRLFWARRDGRWNREKLRQLKARYSEVGSHVQTLHAFSPNSPHVESFLRAVRPDVVIAACKHILTKRVHAIARTGTFALHPGICPEYRNAHGCFWALAERDFEHVGATLLKIDDGIDTGPVYAYLRAPYDEVSESHIVIQRRMVFDSLDVVSQKLIDIHEKRAQSIDVAGRTSQHWGQPWLSTHLQWKKEARRHRSTSAAKTPPTPVFPGLGTAR